MSRRRNIAYVGGALAVVSAITSIVAWWVPSSATWLDHHGFIAWPMAVLSVLLFIWAVLNWQQATRELATVRAETYALVPADRQLFGDFKAALPKDAPVLKWLRYDADTRIYRHSEVAPLSDFVYSWREADQHFVNPELEQVAQQLIEYGLDFLSYQRSHAYPAPARLQLYGEDQVYQYFGGDYDELDRDQYRKRHAMDNELGDRADRVLAAHNELYMIGARLGL